MESSYIRYNKIICLSFNQNNTCFCIGTNKGFTIYKLYPLKDYYIRELKGGVGLISMFNTSNILALVGGGDRPFSSLDTLVIWDDATGKAITSIKVDHEIKSIRVKDSLIIIICKNKSYFYYYDSLENIKNYQKIDEIGIPYNISCILGLSLSPKINIIAYSTKNLGEIKIKQYLQLPDAKNVKEFNITPHQSEVAFIAISFEGDFLASCSEKGTVIKLTSIKDKKVIKELRRGNDNAEIYCINFDKTAQYLLCTSSKGTVHIFNVNDKKDSVVQNKKSIFSSITSYIQTDYLNYFKSEWSFAQCHIDYKGRNFANFCDDNNIIVVLTDEGKYIRAKIPESKSGECKIIEKKDYFYMENNKDDEDTFDY